MHPSEVLSETEREARDRAALHACVALPAAILAITAAYATVRYVVFGPIAAAHIPLYILNKALAWTALVLLALTLTLGPAARLWPDRWGPHLWRRRYWGLVSFGLASLHVMVSLAILNYGYYRLMFQQAFEFTALAEIAMLGGALGWFMLLPPAVASLPGVREQMSGRYWRSLQRGAQMALALGLVHVLYGAPGWLTPANWYGGMPPISLWSAAFVVGAFALRLLARLGAVRSGP